MKKILLLISIVGIFALSSCDNEPIYDDALSYSTTKSINETYPSSTIEETKESETSDSTSKSNENDNNPYPGFDDGWEGEIF